MQTYCTYISNCTRKECRITYFQIRYNSGQREAQYLISHLITTLLFQVCHYTKKTSISKEHSTLPLGNRLEHINNNYCTFRSPEYNPIATASPSGDHLRHDTPPSSSWKWRVARGFNRQDAPSNNLTVIRRVRNFSKVSAKRDSLNLDDDFCFETFLKSSYWLPCILTEFSLSLDLRLL